MSTNRLTKSQLTQLAKNVLGSVELQRQLCDRVYALLQTELREQKDRIGSSVRRLP
ncbi:MAG: hypothetical protein AAFV85_23450 [Cyanobacteria bacterium J06634_6]